MMKKLLVIGSVFMMTACGGAKSDADSSPTTTEATEKETVNVNVSFSEEGKFSLANAATFQVSMEGCASGLTATASELSPSLTAYKNDQGCLAKLKSFSVGGVAYSIGTDFTTWLAGDTAVFTASGSRTLKVKVVSQLSSPTVAGDTVSYSFSEVKTGSSGSINGVSEGKTLAISGDIVPNFSISDITYNGMTSNGAALLNFSLTCNSTMSAGACDGLALTDLSYKLVKDTYSGVLTDSDLAAIFSTAGSTVTVPAEAITNGFTSKELTGPNQMHLNPNLIFVIKNGSSYEYFQVTLDTVLAN